MRVCAKYHSTDSEIWPTGSVKNPRNERTTPDASNTDATIALNFCIGSEFNGLLYEGVTCSQSGCNGYDDTQDDIENILEFLSHDTCDLKLD